MSFLLLMSFAAVLSALVRRLFGRPRSLRTSMRHGMAAAFLFTGVDHFVHDTTRYLPMMPPWFEPLSLELVWFTGAAELAGAIGLLLPAQVYRRLGLPDLRPAAGLGLALLLGFVVIANVHVALSGATVDGLPFGAWYYRLRPLLQPVIVGWALYATGWIGARPEAGAHRAAAPSHVQRTGAPAASR